MRLFGLLLAPGMILLPDSAWAQDVERFLHAQDDLGWLLVLTLLLALSSLALLALRWRRQGKSYARTLSDIDASERRYRDYYDLALVGIVRTSIDGKRILVANLRAAQFYGFDSVEQFIAEGRPLKVYSNPAQRETLLRILREKGKVDSMDVVFRLRDGSLLPMTLSAVLNEAEGYIESVLLDTSALRRAEFLIEEQRNFLQAVIDAMPNPFFYKTTDGSYRLLNRAFEDLLGTRAEDLLGKSVYDVSPKHLADTYHAMDKVLFDSRGPAIQRYESQVQTPIGLRDVVFSKESLFHPHGENAGLVGVITDITRLKETEKQLRLAEERFRSIFMNAAEGIFISVPEGRFLDANPAMARMLGYDSPAALIREMQDIGTQLYVHPEERQAVLARLARDGAISGMDIESKRKDGSRIWMSLSLRAEFRPDGRIDCIQGLAADVSERKRFEHELRHMATTDALTALPNRTQFEEALERMLAQARRSGSNVAVLYLDLDGFKGINDTHGHQIGDELLMQVAGRMRSRLRESDFAARIGGDEFALLLWNVSSKGNAQAVGNDIVSTLVSPYMCGEVQCRVGVSIGAAQYPDDGQSAALLIERADKAMYAVKQRGQGGFAFAGDVLGADSDVTKAG